MIYSSDDDGKIYQQRPAYSRPSKHRPKGWTETVLGYINEAKRWAMCILENRRLMKRPYTWVVHLNINEELPPDSLAAWWPQVCRKLNDRGVVCLWVREPNRLNKLHYHIIVKNAMTRAALEQAIEESMPPRKLVRWRKRVEPIKNEWRLVHYVVKAKITGRNKKGLLVNDLYRDKRLLFKANLPFKKIGTVGDFWEASMTKKALWRQIVDRERQIGEGLEDWQIRHLAHFVHAWFDGDVPLKRVQRAFGYWHDQPVVREWADRLTVQVAADS